MSTRREAREWAVQMLFQIDLNPDEERELKTFFQEFWDGQIRLRNPDIPEKQPPPHIRAFSENIVNGVMSHWEEIDNRISSCATNWDIIRIGNVERNVLRMGIYEIFFAKQKAPHPVIINEAVDICKFFGTRESGRFVNGILDKLAKDYNAELNKPQEWSPSR